MDGEITENNMADGINIAQQSTLPPELYQQQQALNRQQQMATMLMQQNQQPQGQMVSGRYVPTSFFQNLQPVANMLTGAYLAKQGDTKAAQLAEQLRTGRESEKQAAIQAIQKGDVTGALGLPNQYGGTTPFQGALVKAAIPEVPSSVREFEYALKNPEYANYQMGLKKAGATQTPIYVGNKSIAERVGPIMEKEQEKTLAANKIFDSASNLTNALDANKIYTGPGANVKLGIAQLANTAGFGGNTLEEKIANTRTGIQSLAQLTLQGRKEMKGEGAIQVQESQLAERAISGDISLTPTELKILANAAKRSAQYTQQQYERKLQYMASDKDTAGLVPYFSVPPMASVGAPSGLPDQSAIAAEKARRGIK
jgi:hypothetical protein